MRYSTKFNFNLPDGEDTADIEKLTQNFQNIDENIPSNEDLEDKADVSALETKQDKIGTLTRAELQNTLTLDKLTIINGSLQIMNVPAPLNDTNAVNKAYVDTATSGKYEKPIAGIPKTDLDSDVQTSLGKADTALQTSDIDEHYSPQSANAQSGKAVAEAVNPIMRYITYLMKTNFVSITGCDTSISGSYEIPREIGGLPVTRIVLAFQKCIGLTSITIPESVTQISNGAFHRCSGLTEVKIPSSVTQIGISAFYGCTNIANVYYSGTPEQWNAITIGRENEALTNATIHFNQSPAVKQDIYDYHDESKADKTDTYTKSEIDERADEFAQQALVELAKKQDKTDNSLQTESKNIVGAINENAQLIENVKNYVGYEPLDVIGLQVDFENKIFKRLGGAEGKTAGSDFDQFNMFGGRKRCNVADDGTINAYYGDENYTEDGTNGQVMVYQPKFYYKVVPLKLEKNTVSNIGYHIRKANYCVSDNPRPGFKLHPAFYDVNGNEVDYILLSAYEGSMWDASQNKYVNDSVDTSIAYADGDLLCSLPDKKPISGLRSGMGTKAIFEAMANNRGSGWHLETIKATSANQLLMIIEIGMMNTQTALRNGVTDITDNTAYNCSSLTGSTSSLGNASGAAAETINEKGGIKIKYNTNGKVSVSYRGVENPWGNIFKHIQGVNIWGNGNMAGGQPYICDDLTNFNESTNKGSYSGVGFTLPNDSNGYIKAMGYGNPDFDWLLMPSEIGGDSSLPVGDYCYVTANLNGYRITRLGGTWYTGTYDGGFCWFCTYVVDNRHRSIGGRLLYVPTATT